MEKDIQKIKNTIKEVLTNFEDEDEFIECERLPCAEEGKLRHYYNQNYSLDMIYTSKGYLLIKINKTN